MTASLSPLSLAEAFAAIPLAAVCCDQRFAAEEAKLIREQLLTRAPYRSMEPYAFGVLFSGLLGRFRAESWQGLVAEAAPLLEPAHRDTAYALACQLVHCDRSVEPAERQFLVGLAEALGLDPLRRDQVLEVCELLHRDCLASPG
ncbi:MAG: tellurite resistance TerB family protein [Cyanobium sp.]